MSGINNATGRFQVPVEIYVDGFADVGAIGTYRVYISIYEGAEETTEAPVEVAQEP